MNNHSKRLALKILHTMIWIFYNFVLFYMFYLGIIDKIDFTFWIAAFLVLLEGIIVFIFGWKCPLTEFQKKYVENPEIGFDIFLPKWLAKYNLIIYSILFVLSLLLAAYRLMA
jgi:hypothetical protein